MPRPLESPKPGEDFKTVTFRMSAFDWARLERARKIMEERDGYPFGLSTLLRMLIHDYLAREDL